jgi:putative MATE family efflux protein
MDIDRKLFLEENIGVLLFKFTTPAALGMLSIAFASLIDTIFIGKFVGTLALAALALSLPVFMLFSALAATIGIGGSAVWSVDVGAAQYDRADRVFGNVIMMNLLIGFIMFIAGIFFIHPVLSFLATPADVYPFAEGYLRIFFAGSLFIIFVIGMNNFVRAEGNPGIAMMIIVIAVILNIVLDYLFIIIFEWGIEGAALAALLAYSIAFIVMIYHFTLGKSKIKLKRKMFILDFSIIKEIIKIGTASFLRQISIGIMHFLINSSVVWYSGVLAGTYLAIAGISMKCIMFILMPVIGVIQGMQPIIGFNYGARDYIRAKKTIVLAIATAACIASSIWIIIMIFPTEVLSLFSNDKGLIARGENIVRLIILVLPLVAAQTTGAGLFQVLKKPRPANFFAILRQVILLVPLILLLPRFFNLDGVWYAVPLADFIAFLITAIWVIREINLLDKLKDNPEESSEISNLS